MSASRSPPNDKCSTGSIVCHAACQTLLFMPFICQTARKKYCSCPRKTISPSAGHNDIRNLSSEYKISKSLSKKGLLLPTSILKVFPFLSYPFLFKIFVFRVSVITENYETGNILYVLQKNTTQNTIFNQKGYPILKTPNHMIQKLKHLRKKKSK